MEEAVEREGETGRRKNIKIKIRGGQKVNQKEVGKNNRAVQW